MLPLQNHPELRLPANFTAANTARLPFSSLPMIQRITEFSDAFPTRTPVPGNSKRLATFDAAAHFPIPIPATNGELRPENYVLIYEGMTVLCNVGDSAAPDGEYQVQFVVRTPTMPVKLKLNLPILKRELVPSPNTTHPADQNTIQIISQTVGNIALPDIDLVPTQLEQQTRGEIYWLVTCRGYSRTLHALLANLRLDEVRLLRNGSASFPNRF